VYFVVTENKYFQTDISKVLLKFLCFFFLQNVVGVTIGGTLGHALCTGLAVIGGRLIAQRISVRTGT